MTASYLPAEEATKVIEEATEQAESLLPEEETAEEAVEDALEEQAEKLIEEALEDTKDLPPLEAAEALSEAYEEAEDL